MSKPVLSLRENNQMPSIKWKIIKIVYSKATSSFCKLCLTEKLLILNALGDDKCLNKKTEFINKCRHQNKLLLKNVKDSMDWNLVWIFVFEYFVRIVFSFYNFFFYENVYEVYVHLIIAKSIKLRVVYLTCLLV